MAGLRVSGAVLVWLVLALVLIWGGFTGRLPAVLAAILAPASMETGIERASTLTTEAGTHQTEATGTGAFSDGAPGELILAED